MSIVTNVFSALGNNSSLYPIIFKDSIDNGGRVVMAYKEGAKGGQRFAVHDARERFIEENATSLIWIGGIPALKAFYDRVITNKLYKFQNVESLGSTFDKKGKRVFSNININLLAEDGVQNLKKNIKELKDAASNCAGEIENKTIKSIINESEKILANPGKLKKIAAGKMAFSTLIPLAMVGFILSKLIQSSTKDIYGKENKAIEAQKLKQDLIRFQKGKTLNISTFLEQTKVKHQEKSKVSFGSLGSKFVNIFNNDVYNQVILDAGITSGRIITAVNKADKIEKLIKEVGVVFFIYLGGKIVADALEKIAKTMGMPISLDSQILEDKNFHKQILDIAKETDDSKKTAMKEKILKFTGEDEKTILNFIDEQIKSGVKSNSFDNQTLKIAQKLGIIELVEGFKNPLKQIDTNALKGLNESIGEFIEKALSKGSTEEVQKFLKKALNTKRAGIVLNLALCSISTAYLLPKLQYLVREKMTKSSNLPSLTYYDDQFKKLA